MAAGIREFIERMKAEMLSGKPIVVFIKWMNTKKQSNKVKSGVH
ncbi:hypothetical protein [Niallia sp.]|nr:hypothetical protein [Niallia sp.]